MDEKIAKEEAEQKDQNGDGFGGMKPSSGAVSPERSDMTSAEAAEFAWEQHMQNLPEGLVTD